MTTDAIGLYVHVPFCLRKCNYCDFCSFDYLSDGQRKSYVEILCREILSYKEKGLSVDSIFFGGGTPSLLTNDEFRRIVAAIKESFRVLSDTEFTVEVNPKTLDASKASCFKAQGVNRISIGLQSIHENELKILGRIHSYHDFKASYEIARQAGITNVNIDLMYGISEQTMDSFRETLDRVLALSPEHISLYGLMLEEGTPFWKMKESLSLPSEDRECDMYYFATHRLREKGYRHYEISNYSRSGSECRHNLKYWQDREYIGVGVSAYSYFRGVRFGNSRNIDSYINDFSKEREYDTLDADSAAYEYAMLGLRLSDGISLKEYERLFSKNFLDGRTEVLDRLCGAGYLSFDGDSLALTESGFYVSNAILTELL